MGCYLSYLRRTSDFACDVEGVPLQDCVVCGLVDAIGAETAPAIDLDGDRRLVVGRPGGKCCYCVHDVCLLGLLPAVVRIANSVLSKRCLVPKQLSQNKELRVGTHLAHSL